MHLNHSARQHYGNKERKGKRSCVTLVLTTQVLRLMARFMAFMSTLRVTSSTGMCVIFMWKKAAACNGQREIRGTLTLGVHHSSSGQQNLDTWCSLLIIRTAEEPWHLVFTTHHQDSRTLILGVHHSSSWQQNRDTWCSPLIRELPTVLHPHLIHSSLTGQPPHPLLSHLSLDNLIHSSLNSH